MTQQRCTLVPVSQGGATRTGQAETRATDEGMLRELEPWREVGWIFREGGCTAVERRGRETRARDSEI